MSSKKITKAELVEFMGVSLSFVNTKIKSGLIVEKNGLIDAELAVKNIVGSLCRPREYGESRVKLPDSKVAISTLIIIEQFAEEKSVSFGKALELMLLESGSFSEKL
ncbi:MAG: hypothetical protein J7L21_02835 [Sulfurimonas sp.]|nr:hypothetical protein [Sulfurimonas sp.]